MLSAVATLCVCAVFLRRLKIRRGPRRIRSLDKEVRHHTHPSKDLPLHSSCLTQARASDEPLTFKPHLVHVVPVVEAARARRQLPDV